MAKVSTGGPVKDQLHARLLFPSHRHALHVCNNGRSLHNKSHTPDSGACQTQSKPTTRRLGRASEREPTHIKPQSCPFGVALLWGGLIISRYDSNAPLAVGGCYFSAVSSLHSTS